MNEDQQTYQRAASSALLGLGVQIVMTIVLLVVSLWARQPALYGAMLYALGGLGVWICLWLVYQQHRLERIEALEAEQLAAQHGTDNSIFEVSADDLSVARRRLNSLYKWGLPLTSVITSVYLIAVGFYLARLVSARLGAEDQGVPVQVLVLLFVCAGIALVGFLVSRYLAGMAKVPQWQLLRGGATFIMGNVLVLGLLAIAFAAAHYEFYVPLRYMVLVVPVLMIVVGIEMALNLILNFYRPRRPGEVPRPAFESRILGLLTTPESIAKTINETINYQFGFEVTRSWFWQLLSRVFVSLIIFAAAVLVVLSSVVIVEPDYKGVVTRFGALRGEPLEPGIHLKMPWPISRAHYYDTTAIRTLKIGSEPREDVPILWTNVHAEHQASPFVVAPPRDRYTEPDRSVVGDDQELLKVTERAPDVFLVNAEMVVYYTIDPDRLLDYLMSSTQAGARVVDDRLRQLAELEFARHLVRHDVDEWIGTARVEAGRLIRETLQERADAADMGVKIRQVSIPSVHPPQEVAAAFHEVVGAEQRTQTTIQRAEQGAIETLANVAGSPGIADRIVSEIEKHEAMASEGASAEELLEQELLVERLMQQAGGQASVRITQARGYRWEKENVERGNAERFAGQLRAYEYAPSLFRVRRYLEVLAEGLGDSRKYILVGDRSNLTIRGDLTDVEGGFDAAMDFSGSN
ncbi:MAG: SPFH domain-containing protein [Phycisphaeraceae bacterium]